MISHLRMLVALTSTVFIATALTASAQDARADLAIVGARVVDPETGYDAVANIEISGDKIVRITDLPITAKKIIEADGLIAAPGFIDLHAHGQDPFSDKVGVRDGRTTQLDLEAGAWPVTEYLASKEGRSHSNYGVSVGHGAVRMAVLDGIEVGGHGPTTGALRRTAATGNRWAAGQANSAQLDQIDSLLAQGIDDGALGIGVLVGYYPQVGGQDLIRAAKVAQSRGTFISAHSRYLSNTQPSGLLGIQELIALSASYDVPVLLNHLTSTALSETQATLEMMSEARANGIKISAEAYPYARGSTYIGTRMLDEGWQERTGMDYPDLTWAETGETLTEETFAKYRRERPDGIFIMHHIKDADMRAAMLDISVMISSDGMPFTDQRGMLVPENSDFGEGSAHPRGAGTFAKYLRFMIDDGSLSMPQILAKTSLLAAQFLESVAPDMKLRGRLQEGMIADIVLFDPRRVDSPAGYAVGSNSLASSGIPYVIVNGELVVQESNVIEGHFPGKAIRSANFPEVSLRH